MVKGMDWLGQLDAMLPLVWTRWHPNQTSILCQLILQLKLMLRQCSSDAEVFYQTMRHVQLVEMGGLDGVYENMWRWNAIQSPFVLRRDDS